MFRIVNFFKDDTVTPYITEKQVERGKLLQTVDDQNSLSLQYDQKEFKEIY